MNTIWKRKLFDGIRIEVSFFNPYKFMNWLIGLFFAVVSFLIVAYLVVVGMIYIVVQIVFWMTNSVGPLG